MATPILKVRVGITDGDITRDGVVVTINEGNISGTTGE